MENIKNNMGLLFALLVLIMMSLTCHIKHMWNNWTKKNVSRNNNVSRLNNVSRTNNMERFQLTGDIPSDDDIERYNRINYLDLDKCTGLPCSRIREEDHPDIPCSMYKKCFQTVEADMPYQLSEEDKMLMYLVAYGEAGLESMGRRRRRGRNNNNN